MKKLIAFDIDGTILKNGEISNEIYNAFKILNENGIILVPNTGRTLKSLKKYFEKLGLYENLDIGIFNTGAVIQKISTGQIIYHFNLTMDDYYKIKEVTPEKLGPYIYTPFEAYYMNSYNSMFKKDVDFLEMSINKIGKNEDIEISRINVMGEKEELDKVYEMYKQKFEKDYYIVRNIDESIEFLNKKANKGLTLKYLIDKMNMNDLNVITIGDGNNDIEMFENSDISIAMGNSPDNVKKSAKILTDSVDNNGFLKIFDFLRKFK